MPEIILCNADEPDVVPAPARVIVELAHPTLRFGEWRERFLKYAAEGVEEYYLIHPGPPMDVEVWCRQGGQLAPIRDLNGWVSPHLGLRFSLDTDELTVFDRGGRLLRTTAEVVAVLRELGVDPVTV